MHISVLSADTRSLAALPAFALVLLILPVFTTGVLCTAAIECADSKDAAALAYALVSWAAVGLLLLWMRGRGVPFSALGWRRPARQDWIWAFVACLIGIFAVYPLAQFFNGLLGLSFGKTLQVPTLTWTGIVIQLFYAVITAPLTEETLFRGFAIGHLRARGWLLLPACGLPLTVFALVHWPGFGAGGVLFIALWAVLPTVLYLLRGNLAAPALMHAMNNLLAYIVFPLVGFSG